MKGKLKEQGKSFTEAGKSDYDALSKMLGSMKKKMAQIGENLWKELLSELPDSKGENAGETKQSDDPKKKLRWISSKCPISKEKPNVHWKNIDFCAMMDETKNDKFTEAF